MLVFHCLVSTVESNSEAGKAHERRVQAGCNRWRRVASMRLGTTRRKDRKLGEGSDQEENRAAGGKE